MAEYDLVIPAFVLLFISSWMANTLNLYSTALTFSTLNTHWTYQKVVITSSVFGTIFAFLGFSNYLFQFLELLGIFTPAVASIYLYHYFYLKKQIYLEEEIKVWESSAILSWVLSSLITVASYLELITITGAYFVDSILLGVSIYMFLQYLDKSIFNRAKNRRSKRKA